MRIASGDAVIGSLDQVAEHLSGSAGTRVAGESRGIQYRQPEATASVR
jgi:hypothetical protein